MDTTVTDNSKQKLQLAAIMHDLLLVLSPKEKEVVMKRFCLDNGPRLTLEKIGQQYAVTRERIRQIEKIALGKLRRTVLNSKLSTVNELANGIVKSHGNVCVEPVIISEVLSALGTQNEVDGHIVRLALHINPLIEKTEKSNVYTPFWSFKEISIADIEHAIAVGTESLQGSGDVVPFQQLAQMVQTKLQQQGKQMETTTILSALEADKRLKKTKDGFGLMTWRHINPRSIRDKAYIVLKKEGHPLHFVEIANKIIENGFDKKMVTVQAVHNELIRYDQFVLVGRGLYALKEWGYKKGTVSEIIEGLLRKKSPLSKQEIIAGVLKQRQVKKGTISLNLQKNTSFIRVGRAMYSLKSK